MTRRSSSFGASLEGSSIVRAPVSTHSELPGKPGGSTVSLDLKRAVIDFVQHASIEISPHDEGLLAAVAGKLPPGTSVYIAYTPDSSLEDVVRVAVKAQALGLTAFPHIVARRLPNERELREALGELREGGVEHLLLVAGDMERPVGKFSSTLDVLDTGLLEHAGLKRIGVCGHPEGHRAIGPTALLRALRHKQDFARKTGIPVHVVTQFGFNSQAVCAWDRHLAAEGISLPVHVGIAGPTPLRKLIGFAMRCGVGASMLSLVKNLSAMSSLARPAMSPDEVLIGLVRCRAAYEGSRIVQSHFYSFGGAVTTASWLRTVIDGAFVLEPDGEKFIAGA